MDRSSSRIIHLVLWGFYRMEIDDQTLNPLANLTGGADVFSIFALSPNKVLSFTTLALLLNKTIWL